MAEMDDKLGAILNNPAMMQQIMTMAQALEQQNQPQPEPVEGLNPAMVQNIMLLSNQTGIDSNQEALLTALNPYLPQPRLQKLEKAMRAAKLARVASTFLSQGGGFHL